MSLNFGFLGQLLGVGVFRLERVYILCDVLLVGVCVMGFCECQ